MLHKDEGEMGVFAKSRIIIYFHPFFVIFFFSFLILYCILFQQDVSKQICVLAVTLGIIIMELRCI